nr:hypothetical protein [uncultured Actinoplanes sp.]
MSRIDDELTVAHDDAAGASAVIRSIELHSLPGKTTVAIDVELADSVSDGTVLTRS